MLMVRFSGFVPLFKCSLLSWKQFTFQVLSVHYVLSVQSIRVHAKVDTVGEFKLRPKLAPAGMGMEPILQMPKFLFLLWADVATSRTADGD